LWHARSPRFARELDKARPLCLDSDPKLAASDKNRVRMMHSEGCAGISQPTAAYSVTSSARPSREIGTVSKIVGGLHVDDQIDFRGCCTGQRPVSHLENAAG